MKAGIGVGRRDVGVAPVTMFCSCTTRSRLSCSEKAIVRLFGTNFEVSYPPNVKLPKTLFNPSLIDQLQCRYSSHQYERPNCSLNPTEYRPLK
jgi:hypothetical protein